MTTIPIYFTSWITHFCAPAFSFLAGTSAFLSGRNKTIPQLSSFLFKRGLWLVFVWIAIENFVWFFSYRLTVTSVIWTLGISMILLALLIRLQRNAILAISLIIIFGHNLLDSIHFEGNFLWALLHEGGRFNFVEGHDFFVAWPLIPWIAVMPLGYCFGQLYSREYSPQSRKKILNVAGISALILFIILRFINQYGDPYPWNEYPDPTQTVMSFFRVMKFPPSLMFLCMTLGPALLFLANSERIRGKIADFFVTLGRVPFFYYLLHLFLIHIIVLVFAANSAFDWDLLRYQWLLNYEKLQGFGYPLWVVYLVWIGVIALTYPLCRMFEKYKMSNKQKWWLSYL